VGMLLRLGQLARDRALFVQCVPNKWRERPFRMNGGIQWWNDEIFVR
jgi:hypothetical protein